MASKDKKLGNLCCVRGMAEDTDAGIKVILDDYPYAEDGLLIWNALETYFTEYLHLYYSDDGQGGKSKVCCPSS